MGHIFFWPIEFADSKGTTRSRNLRAFRWYTWHRRKVTARKRYGRFNLFRVVNNCVSAQFSDKQALPRPPLGCLNWQGSYCGPWCAIFNNAASFPCLSQEILFFFILGGKIQRFKVPASSSSAIILRFYWWVLIYWWVLSPFTPLNQLSVPGHC